MRLFDRHKSCQFRALKICLKRGQSIVLTTLWRIGSGHIAPHETISSRKGNKGRKVFSSSPLRTWHALHEEQSQGDIKETEMTNGRCSQLNANSGATLRPKPALPTFLSSAISPSRYGFERRKNNFPAGDGMFKELVPLDGGPTPLLADQPLGLARSPF